MENYFVEWLKISKLTNKDLIFIFSVGGGSLEKNISVNLVEAIKYGKSVGSRITGVVGKDGGYTAQNSDTCIIIPIVNDQNILRTQKLSRQSFAHSLTKTKN